VLVLLLLSSCFSRPRIYPTAHRDPPPLRHDLGFSWNNCGKSTDPVQVLSAVVTPDPLILGGDITFSASVSVAQNVTAPVTLAVTIWSLVWGIWTEIPCVDGIGSCTISDVCALLTEKVTVCPAWLLGDGVSCWCPYDAKTYSVPSTTLTTTNPGYSWLTNGNYSAQLQATDSNGNNLGCALIYINLGSNDL